jgi:hypothetical protein
MDQAVQLMDTAGVYINPQDPEWQTVATAPREGYLAAISAGIVTKAKRVSTPPEARLSGLGAGTLPASPLPANLSPMELLKMAKRKT